MNEDFYISLIYKRLDGQISAVEEEQLSLWLAEDAEHQALADDLEAVYTESDDYLAEEIDGVDVDAAFLEQIALIGEEFETAAPQEKPAKVVQINEKPRRLGLRRMQIVSIVASVVALIVVGVWWMDLQNGVETLTAKAEIGAGAMEVTLSDGSEVILEEGSELEYPSKFTNNARTIRLVRGKANFSVTKNQGEFTVLTQKGTVTVLGTVFDVLLSEEELKLTVTEGKVELQSGGDYASNNTTMLVEIGEEAILRGQSIYKTKFTEDGRVNYFKFEDVRLTSALREIESYFNTKIEVSEALSKCNWTTTLDNKTLSEILKIVDATYNSQSIETNEGSYIIKNGVCQ